MIKVPYLTPTQLDVMELQFVIYVKDTYEAIHGSARAPAEPAAATAAATEPGPSPPVSWADGALKLPAARPAAAARVLFHLNRGSARSSPSASFCWATWSARSGATIWCSAPLPFWAAPSIIAKFPTLAALARGEFAGLGAEATSERTFSYSGRVFSKLRRSMSMENLSAMVIGAAYPGVLTNDDIMAKYASEHASD